jgi:Protein of unknown function (DUF1461)
MIRRQFSSLFRALPWAMFTMLAVVACLFVAWKALIAVDYLYPVWYEALDIDQTIAQYGPQNRQGKLSFETTTKSERVRLFAALADAIHDRGQGLENLVYHDSSGRPITTLLTAPEVVHLQDVARLFGWLQKAGWLALAALIALCCWLRWRQRVLPSLRKLLWGTVSGIAIVGVVTIALGPVKVFYQLHEWIFPQGHQWFFFYEDSLMSMMMKAPALFGPIALTWAALSLLLISMLLIAAKQLLRR